MPDTEVIIRLRVRGPSVPPEPYQGPSRRVVEDALDSHFEDLVGELAAMVIRKTAAGNVVPLERYATVKVEDVQIAFDDA